MFWTNDKPTIPGWYWYDDGDTDLEIYHVYLYSGTEGRLVASIVEGVGEDVKNMSGRWAGPIEPPNEKCMSSEKSQSNRYVESIRFWTRLQAAIQRNGFLHEGGMYYYPCACGHAVVQEHQKRKGGEISICADCFHDDCACERARKGHPFQGANS